MSIQERKRTLRRSANDAIAALTAADRRVRDEAICVALRALDAYRDAEQVLAY